MSLAESHLQLMLARAALLGRTYSIGITRTTCDRNGPVHLLNRASSESSARSHDLQQLKFTAMRRTILILFTVAGLSSQEAFAGDCDAHSGCRKFSIYQAAPTYGPPPFVAFGSTVGPIVGCYGFDHGPIYSPHPCNFPYPCEYYGTCKAAAGRAAKPYKGTF